MGTQTFYLHLDIDAFFVACEEAVNPHLRGKPVIVGGKRGRRGVVASASYEARKYGVRSGMPTQQALRLCPHCVVIPHHFALYQTMSQRFFAILTHLAPKVEPLSIDEAYLDLTGVADTEQGIVAFARHVLQETRRQLRLSVSGGLAIRRIVAKMATEHAKPQGFYVVPPSQTQAFLGRHRLEEVPGIGPKTLARLHQLGLFTVRDLQETPLRVLRERFPDGLAYALHALAYGQEVPRYIGRERRISREVTLEEDLPWSEPLWALLLNLADDVAMALVTENLWALGVGVRVRYPNFRTVSRQRKLTEATRDPRVLYRLAHQLLKPLVQGRRVRLIGIFTFHPVQHPPLSLFPSASSTGPKDGQDLAQVLQRIRRTHGPHALRFARQLLEPSPPANPEESRSFFREHL